jgi:hypothetical protein
MGKNKEGKITYLALAKNMIDFYNDNVLNNKKHVAALQSYKWSGYNLINQILLQQVQQEISIQDILQAFNYQEKKSIDMKKIIASTIAYMYQDIKEHIQTIKQLDVIICNAPTMIPETLTVYRGMSVDIYNDLQCVDKKFYYTCPTYMSTSLSPAITDFFVGSNGFKYIIHLPTTTKGIFLPWQIDHSKDFGNATIDSEFELLLLRGSKFLIESVSYEPEPLHKQRFLKYKNIPCYEKLPVFVKTYTMRLVSQPSLEELKKNYSKMMKDIKLELKPWDLKEMNLSELHPSKMST